MFHKYIWLLFFMLGFVQCRVIGSPHAASFYEQKGYVNDYAHALDPKTVAFLDTQLSSLQKADDISFIVVVVASLENRSIEDVAQDFFARWQIGHLSRDSGILLLIAVDEQKAFIELGYGIPEPITDSDARRITHEILQPLLQQNKINQAVAFGVQHVFETLGKSFGKDGVKTVRTVYTTQYVVVFLVSLILLYLTARFAPSKYFFLSPTIGFFAGLTQSIGLAIALAFLGALMVLICYMLKTFLPQPLKRRRKK
jgi:uncharacterized membrane protein YgcG